MNSPSIHVRRLLLPLLAALVALGLAPATVRADDSQLSDPFDTLSDVWHPVAGNWSAVDGAARADAGPADRGYSLALKGLRLDGAGSVTTTFSLSGEAAGSSWGGVHLHRGPVTDDYAASGYTALLRRNGELAIIKARDGVNVEYLGRTQTSARPAEGPVTLTFSAGDDGTLTASVADMVLEVSDATFRGGGISLVSHRDSAVAFEHVDITGLVPADDTLPVPTDCIPPSDDPVEPSRGDVFISPERISEITARVDAGIEPQASAFDLLARDVAVDMERTPAAPDMYFVPWFYNDPDAHRAARDGLQNDANAAYRLALAYRISGDEAYGTKAASFLDDWADVDCFRTREDSALAFSYHFPAMVFAAELLRGSPVWPAEDEAAFASMLRWQALGVTSSITGSENNWGSWGVAATAAISAYLGEGELLDDTLERASDLLELQISEEGYLMHEVTRNNGVGDYGIWYSHFSLFPNVLTAEIGLRNGVDLFEYETAAGVTLEDAIHVVAGWLEDLDTFPFYDGADKSKLANVRTIDYLRADGIIAHSMSYFEIAANHYDLDAVDRLLAEEQPMTTIHSAPHLTLTHGSLAEPVPGVDPDPSPQPTDPVPSPTPTVTVTAEPSPAPTVTVTAEPLPAPTVTASPTVTVTAEPSSAPTPTSTVPPVLDVHATPGFHRVNGRDWMTVCEPYSQTTRCWTHIWATQVQNHGDTYVNVSGWVFNTLTYLPELPRSAWAANPLGNPGEWVAQDGRTWRTECDTAATGRNGCRNYAMAKVVGASRDGATWTFHVRDQWVLNSIVRFG